MRLKFLFAVIASINFNQTLQAQTRLSQKLENISSLATIQELVSSFGKEFQIRREAWWKQGDYELYYPKKGFGLMVSQFQIPRGENRQVYVGAFIYPEVFPDKIYFGIAVKSAKLLKDFHLQEWKSNNIFLGDMGSVIRPIIGSNAFYKDVFSIDIYMPIQDSKYFPDPCLDYTVLGGDGINCEFQITLDTNGEMKSIITREIGGVPLQMRRVDFLKYNSKLIQNQMNRSIDRLYIVRQSAFQTLEYEEYKAKP